MPLLTKKSLIAAKIETTPGTAESLLAAQGALSVFDLEPIQPNIEFVQRPGLAAFAPIAGVPAARLGGVRFKTFCNSDGAGAVPLWASTFLPACGFVDSLATFSPTSEMPGSNVKCATIGYYLDGVKKLLRGCAGNFEITMVAGEPVVIQWEFSGVFDSPADVALLAPTFPEIEPLRFASSTFTLGGATLLARTVTINSGNNMQPREDPTDLAGADRYHLTDRRITVQADYEAELVGTEDFYGKWVGRTEQALAINLGSGTNEVDFAAPQCQITNIQQGDRNGMAVENVEMQCNRSAAGGDDELTITFG